MANTARRAILAQVESRVGSGSLRRGPLPDEMRFKVMRLLQQNSQLSQRDVAKMLGISVGKVNYCVRALIRKGWIKAVNFKNHQNKAAYMYLLTTKGIEAKAHLTVEFLQIKMREYEMLRLEIEQMRREAERERG